MKKITKQKKTDILLFDLSHLVFQQLCPYIENYFKFFQIKLHNYINYYTKQDKMNQTSILDKSPFFLLQ